MEKSRRFSTISLATALLAALISLPLFKFTWSVADLWIRFWLRPPDVFYIDSWMSSRVLITTLAGLFVLLLVVIGAIASVRASWPRWLIVALPIAIAVTLCSMLNMLNLPLWNTEIIYDSAYLTTIEHSLVEWSRENGRFPTTQNELLNATAGESQIQSIYRQRKHILSHQLYFLPDQDGPYTTQPNQPGIVYYAVNQSGNQFWLTVSGLNLAVSNKPVMLQTDPFTASKQPWGNFLS